MSKFMKGCAWAALVLIVLGLIIVITAGSARGASMIHSVVDKVTGGLVQVNLTGWNDWGVSIKNDLENGSLFELGEEINYNIDDTTIFDKDHEIFSGDVQRDFTGSEIQKLDVEVGGCEFTIKESEDDRFYVEAENTRKFQSYVKGNTLCIKGTVKTVVNGGQACNIILYVPTGFSFERITMSVGAGVMNMGSIQAQKAELEVGAGQITAQQLIGEDLILSVGVGECNIENMKTQKLDAKVGMGQLVVGQLTGEKIIMECAMGNIKMEIDDALENYDYEVECGMGNVNIGNESYSGSSERSVDNGASRKIDVECAMGNVDITFTE